MPWRQQRNELRAALAGPFQRVFDIEMSRVSANKTQIEAMSIPEEIWEWRGYHVYNEQTPAMWRY